MNCPKSTNINTIYKNDLKTNCEIYQMTNLPQQTLTNIKTIKCFDTIAYFTTINEKNSKIKKVQYFSPLKKALENRKDNEFTIKFDEEVGQKTYIKYLNLTYDKLEQESWKKNNHFFEIIPQDKPFKFYIDIDKRYINDSNNELVLEQVFKLMKNEFNFNIDNDNYSMSFGKGQKDDYTKVSWHIIFEDIIFKNMEECKIFMNHLKFTIETNNDYSDLREGVFDFAPYKTNQAFKLPYQTKAFKKIQQKPTNSNKNLSNFLLTNINTNKFVDISNVKNYDVKPYKLKTKSGKQIEVSFAQGIILKTLKNSMPKNFKLKPIDPKLNKNDLPYYLESIPNHKDMPHLIWQTIGYCISNITKNSEKGLELWAKWTSQYKPTTKDDLRPIYEKHSTEKGFKWGMLTNMASLFNKKIGQNESIFDILFDDTPTYNCKTKIINSRYMGKSINILDEINNYDIINIKSPMGTGKSHDLKYVFENTNYSVCYLSCKRAFASSMIHEFGDYGFVNYMDIEYKNEIINHDRVIISIESIQYCRDKYDLIIIDESESICDNLGGQMFVKNKPIEGALQLFKMVENSKKILVMDAYLSTRSFDFLKDIFNDKVNEKKSLYIKNDFQYPRRKYIDNSIESFNSQIKHSILKGKRCAICCGSKSMVKKVMRYLEDSMHIEDSKVLIYDNENPLPNGIDLNEEWKDADVVIYTPTITAGISYDNKDYPFDNLFIYAVNCNSCHFRDMIQAHKRIRFFTNNIINICISSSWKYGENEKPFRIEKVIEQNDFKSLLFKDEKEIKSFKDIDKLKYLYNIHIHNILERNISDRFLDKFSKKYLELENIVNIENDNQNDNDFDDTDFADDWIYNDIKNISTNEKDKIQAKYNDISNNSEKVSDEEKKMLTKYNFKNKQTNDDVNDEIKSLFFDKFYKTNEFRKECYSVRQFKQMLYDIEYDFNKFNDWKINKGFGRESQGRPLEIYEMRLKRYEHIIRIFNGLGFIKDGKFDINHEFYGGDFEQFKPIYDNVDVKTLNAMLNKPTIRIDKETTKYEPKQIKGIFNQLLMAEFGMEVKGNGFKYIRINGKKKKLTKMIIQNYIETDMPNEHKELLHSIKYNKFMVFKNNFSNQIEPNIIINEEPPKPKFKFIVKKKNVEKKHNFSVNQCQICGKNCFNSKCLKCLEKEF